MAQADKFQVAVPITYRNGEGVIVKDTLYKEEWVMPENDLLAEKRAKLAQKNSVLDTKIIPFLDGIEQNVCYTLQREAQMKIPEILRFIENDRTYLRFDVELSPIESTLEKYLKRIKVPSAYLLELIEKLKSALFSYEKVIGEIEKLEEEIKSLTSNKPLLKFNYFKFELKKYYTLSLNEPHPSEAHFIKEVVEEITENIKPCKVKKHLHIIGEGIPVAEKHGIVVRPVGKGWWSKDTHPFRVSNSLPYQRPNGEWGDDANGVRKRVGAITYPKTLPKYKVGKVNQKKVELLKAQPKHIVLN